MDYVRVILTLRDIVDNQAEKRVSELAANILKHIEEHAGEMIIKNVLNVEAIIKVAYASEITNINIPFSYGKIIDLYNWMKEKRGSKYRIELNSRLASLPPGGLIAYSDTLPIVDGFLEIQLALSGSSLGITTVDDL